MTSHPEIPRRFRHVHPRWKAMTESERRAFGKRRAERGDWATLDLYEAWADWFTRHTSPWRWQLEVAR